VTLDDVALPTSVARGSYGRYTDGNTWQSIDNNTAAAANTIPEFQDIAVPLLGLTMMIVASGYRRRGQAKQADTPNSP
jgi:hypothetical protein